MQLEALGQRGEFGGDRVQLRQRHRGLGLLRPVQHPVRRPVDGVRRLEVREDRLVGVLPLVHRVAIGGHHRVGLFQRHHAGSGELLRVPAARAGVLGNALVHQRLRDHRLVGLVVAVAAEA